MKEEEDREQLSGAGLLSSLSNVLHRPLFCSSEKSETALCLQLRRTFLFSFRRSSFSFVTLNPPCLCKVLPSLSTPPL